MSSRTLLVLAAAAAVSLSACGQSTQTSSTGPAQGTPSPTTATAPMTSGTASMMPGAYVDYAAYQASSSMYAGTKTVLFFHAPWCPDCCEVDASLSSSVPDGLVVVKVDYDSMTDLKARYGVTQQHVFVQVDAQGSATKKWTGTFDGAAIKAATV